MAEVASNVEGNGVKKVYLSPLVHLCASTAGQCHVRSYTPFLCPVPRSLLSAWLYPGANSLPVDESQCRQV